MNTYTSTLLLFSLLLLSADFVEAEDTSSNEGSVDVTEKKIDKPEGNDGGESLRPLSTYSDKEIYKIQIKNQALIKLLIKQGLLDKNTARQITNFAEQEAAKKYGEATDVVTEENKDAPAEIERGVVRVPYVSETVIEQIREEVKKELEAEVTNDVMQHAKNERWGVTDSWPSWLNKVKLSGDFRFTAESIQFSDDNFGQFLNVLAVNRAGGLVPAGPDRFLNTTVDDDRLRIRARLDIHAELDKNWEVGFKFATGSGQNPVSNTQTLSNYFSDSSLNLNRAFIHYGQEDLSQFNFWFGRFKNPFVRTTLVWDNDLNFDGISGTYAPLREFHSTLPKKGFDPFVTLGAFPLQEVPLFEDDKWLYGAQIGFNIIWESQSKLQFGIAYYDYQNIHGELNDPGSIVRDFTAPQFVQNGNLVFDIRDDEDDQTEFIALASDYNLINYTLIYDIANFAPHHIILSADLVENTGFDGIERLLEFGVINAEEAESVQENVDGYHLKVLVGYPKIELSGQWRASLAYKYVESDAVLDAFTDSVFHIGGTDAEGYIVEGQYGIAKNTSIELRLFSSNEINGDPLGVTRWQLNLHAKF